MKIDKSLKALTALLSIVGVAAVLYAAQKMKKNKSLKALLALLSIVGVLLYAAQIMKKDESLKALPALLSIVAVPLYAAPKIGEILDNIKDEKKHKKNGSLGEKDEDLLELIHEVALSNKKTGEFLEKSTSK